MRHIIYSDLLGLFVKILIHNQSEIVDRKYLIRRFWLIQNHCKLRTASPTALQIDSDGADFLTLEILFQNLFSFLGHMNHEILLSL